jgi:hypothetical protein
MANFKYKLKELKVGDTESRNGRKSTVTAIDPETGAITWSIEDVADFENAHNTLVKAKNFIDNLIASPEAKGDFQLRTIAKEVRDAYNHYRNHLRKNYPEEYKKTVPLIKDVDELYAKLTPEQYKLQRKKANQTHFKIPGTSFTTVTTNVNFQTSIHTDKGDDQEGFGNLAVIERDGKYEGAETCFPQYGIGVDVRSGDILFMDVHQPHANLPMIKKDKDAIRLSIVCYLRTNVWLRTKNRTRRFYESHNKTVKNLRRIDP